MQQENNSGAFQNRDSFYMSYNSNHSIDRFRLRDHSSSLQNRASLVQAMDLQENNRNSDIYENVLGDKSRSSNFRRSSNISRGQRPSSKLCRIRAQDKSNSQRIMHECSCSNQCNQEHCMCLAGLCCQKCIKLKNQCMNPSNVSMSSGCVCKNIKCLKMYCKCYREGRKCQKGRCECQGCENIEDGLLQVKKKKMQVQLQQKSQNQRGNYHFGNIKKPIIETKNYQFLNCSCKKSHCLKKYCSCYLNGKQCNQFCICQECKNKYEEGDEDQSRSQKQRRTQRFARCELEEDQQKKQINEDIGQFLDQQQEDFSYQQLNRNIQFQPVNFSNAGK